MIGIKLRNYLIYFLIVFFLIQNKGGWMIGWFLVDFVLHCLLQLKKGLNYILVFMSWFFLNFLLLLCLQDFDHRNIDFKGSFGSVDLCLRIDFKILLRMILSQKYVLELGPYNKSCVLILLVIHVGSIDINNILEHRIILQLWTKDSSVMKEVVILMELCLVSFGLQLSEFFKSLKYTVFL